MNPYPFALLNHFTVPFNRSTYFSGAVCSTAHNPIEAILLLPERAVKQGIPRS